MTIDFDQKLMRDPLLPRSLEKQAVPRASLQVPVNTLIQNERRRQRNDWLEAWAKYKDNGGGAGGQLTTDAMWMDPN